jgi:hypothetical protein
LSALNCQYESADDALYSDAILTSVLNVCVWLVLVTMIKFFYINLRAYINKQKEALFLLSSHMKTLSVKLITTANLWQAIITSQWATMMDYTANPPYSLTNMQACIILISG